MNIPQSPSPRNRLFSYVKTISTVLLGILGSALVQAGDTPTPEPLLEQSSDWKGNTKKSFTIDGHACFIVVPKTAAPHKPWVWRTSFPDYHDEIDLALVQKGFHLGYIDVLEMLGSDPALDLMDKFYDKVRAQWGLSEKPTLEAVSRGGLHAYRYAGRHPERITCIYADVPVMDLKSWPLKNPGAAPQLKDALNYYGFKSENELKSFKNNPLDLLETLATAKIPLRHIISLDDKIVPPEENTLEAQRRLKKFDWEMDLVILKNGTTESNGHHFPLSEATETVNFILKQTSASAGF